MSGSLIPVPYPCYELRLGPPGWRHGLPGYQRGCVVWDHGDGLAQIRLVVGRLQPSEMREIIRLLRQRTFTHLLVERRDADGTPRTHVVDIRKGGRKGGRRGRRRRLLEHAPPTTTAS